MRPATLINPARLPLLASSAVGAASSGSRAAKCGIDDFLVELQRVGLHVTKEQGERNGSSTQKNHRADRLRPPLHPPGITYRDAWVE